MTASGDVSTYGDPGEVAAPLAGRRVAVVGVGRMGRAMAGRLASSGAALLLWNRTRSRADDLAGGLGGSVVGTAREAAAGADVVLVSLADDAAVDAAYGGDDGLVAGVHPGVVVVDTSTVDPDTARRAAVGVRDRGGQHLDAPVSGSTALAERGALTFMVGGAGDALERVRDVLDVLGARTFQVGDAGAGATTKLVVNAVLLALNQALAEGLGLAERAGVDRATAYEVLAASAVGAPYLGYKREAFLDPDRTPPAFTLDLVAKDLRLAEALAGRVGARTDQLAVNLSVAREAVAAGLGDADMSALAGLLRG